MTLNLDDYRRLGRGLTDDSLNTYLDSQSVSRFDNAQNKAKRLLNQFALGVKNPHANLEIEGLANFEDRVLEVKNGLDITEYDFSELSQDYLNDLDQGTTNVPITKTALAIMDKKYSSDKDRPLIDQSMDLAGSSKQLETAFNNEMVFGVNLEKYLKKSGLANSYESHKDKYTKLIDKMGTQYSFNDGMRDLQKSVKGMEQ